MVEPQASLAKDETDESKKRRYETPEGRETDEGTKPCATEESERCLYSNLILILLIVSIACLGISIKYQWVQVSLRISCMCFNFKRVSQYRPAAQAKVSYLSVS